MSLAHCLRTLICLILIWQLAACSQLPKQNLSDSTTKLTPSTTNSTTLARKLHPHIKKHPNLSGFYLMLNDLSAFNIRLELIDLAEKSIDVQYYLFHDDIVGNLFLEHLLAAADRGVRVRLLLDDMGAFGQDKKLKAFASHRNISVKVFNPFANRHSQLIDLVSRPHKIDRRMHNKSFTVDNQVTVVGGRNIGNEYFYADKRLRFGDLDVLGVGPIAVEVTDSFDQYWNTPLAYAIKDLYKKPADSFDLRKQLAASTTSLPSKKYQERLAKAELNNFFGTTALPLDWGKATLYQDPPEKVRWQRKKHNNHLGAVINDQLANTRQEILLVTPYFVPGKEGVGALAALVKNGTDVHALTNSLASTDVRLVHSGYMKYRMELLKAGVKMYEMKPDPRLDLENPNKRDKALFSLHAKLFVFDRKSLFIGSMNLDPRSAHLNTELGILIEHPGMASSAAKQFHDLLDRLAYRLMLNEDDDEAWIRWQEQTPKGSQLHLKEPHQRHVDIIKIALLQLLPIESQL
jgi:putative cardiolipin synthase